MFWLSIIITAILSGLFTCLLVSYWIQVKLWPRLIEQIDEEFRVRLQEASDVLGDRVERSVRKGVVEGVTSLASREVLTGTTRTIARSGAEIVEESLGWILGRRPPRGPDRDE